MGFFKSAIKKLASDSDQKETAHSSSNQKKDINVSSDTPISLLQVKKPLTASEQKFYLLLKEALPKYNILSQVSFHRFLYTSGGGRKENFRLFAKVRQKSADFLICDNYFNIQYVIELDDKTHQEEKDQERDEYLKQAGIKTLRYHVKNMPSIEEIKSNFK